MWGGSEAKTMNRLWYLGIQAARSKLAAAGRDRVSPHRLATSAACEGYSCVSSSKTVTAIRGVEAAPGEAPATGFI